MNEFGTAAATREQVLQRIREDSRFVLANFQDLHEGDVLETYETRLQERVLSS